EIGLFKHQMDRRLRERERWSSTMLRSIGDAVVSTDAIGQITFMNTVAENLTGRRLEDVKGRPIRTLVQALEAITSQTIADPVARVRRGELRDRDSARVEAPG